MFFVLLGWHKNGFANWWLMMFVITVTFFVGGFSAACETIIRVWPVALLGGPRFPQTGRRADAQNQPFRGPRQLVAPTANKDLIVSVVGACELAAIAVILSDASPVSQRKEFRCSIWSSRESSPNLCAIRCLDDSYV